MNQISDAWSRHRALKTIAKYTSRRSSSVNSAPSSPTSTQSPSSNFSIGSTMGRRIPKKNYDWNAPNTLQRHASEYHDDGEDYHARLEARQRRAILARQNTISSLQRNNSSSSVSTGGAREGVLIVLATEEEENNVSNSSPFYGNSGNYVAEPVSMLSNAFDPVPTPSLRIQNSGNSSHSSTDSSYSNLDYLDGFSAVATPASPSAIPRRLTTNPFETHQAVTSRNCQSFDIPSRPQTNCIQRSNSVRMAPTIPQNPQRQATYPVIPTAAGKKTPWWKKTLKRRGGTDPRTVRSSEEYNALESVPTTRLYI
ncbi:hypothetical protein DFS34DRAFT_633737 [Phlyctochytrium arcticum]|nr:hypothetical protein DFS34DRAFT_633737 [Phlyctochytrium arcticum]